MLYQASSPKISKWTTSNDDKDYHQVCHKILGCWMKVAFNSKLTSLLAYKAWLHMSRQSTLEVADFLSVFSFSISIIFNIKRKFQENNGYSNY